MCHKLKQFYTLLRTAHVGCTWLRLILNWFIDGGTITPFDAAATPRQLAEIDHAIRLVGWGVTGDGVEYWIGANSWGQWWGDQGYFYITSGKNTNGIEQIIQAPLIKAINWR